MFLGLPIIMEGSDNANNLFIQPYTPVETLLSWVRLKNYYLENVVSRLFMVRSYWAFQFFEQIRVATLWLLHFQ